MFWQRCIAGHIVWANPRSLALNKSINCALKSDLKEEENPKTSK